MTQKQIGQHRTGVRKLELPEALSQSNYSLNNSNSIKRKPDGGSATPVEFRAYKRQTSRTGVQRNVRGIQVKQTGKR